MSLKPFLPKFNGIEYAWRDEPDGGGTVISRQYVDDILEANKAQANENSGWSKDKSMRRVASIPLSLIHKWRVEEGWDAFNPIYADKLKEKLNSSEFLYLRTALWNM